MSEIGPDTDLTSMSVVELKKALKAKGLTTTGKKQDLIDRLQLAMDSEDANDLLDDANELLGEDDEDVVTVSKPAAPKPAEKPKSEAKPVAVAKPVEPKKPEEESASTEEKPSNIKTMSDSERAAARAARFGGTTSAESEAKKQARAERFGIKSGKIGDSPSADLETLKKRAERFGQSSSNAMKKAELDEKIKKRQERFGVVEPEIKKFKKSGVLNDVGLNKTLKDKPMDEKMMKRAERFGTVTS